MFLALLQSSCTWLHRLWSLRQALGLEEIQPWPPRPESAAVCQQAWDQGWWGLQKFNNKLDLKVGKVCRGLRTSLISRLVESATNCEHAWYQGLRISLWERLVLKLWSLQLSVSTFGLKARLVLKLVQPFSSIELFRIVSNKNTT